jgi:hypothetical protein
MTPGNVLLSPDQLRILCSVIVNVSSDRDTQHVPSFGWDCVAATQAAANNHAGDIARISGVDHHVGGHVVVAYVPGGGASLPGPANKSSDAKQAVKRCSRKL